MMVFWLFLQILRRYTAEYFNAINVVKLGLSRHKCSINHKCWLELLMFKFSTSAPISQNPCYRLLFFGSRTIYKSIVLNVKFIRGLSMRFVGGSRCSQCDCVMSFITNRLPCSKINEMVSFVSLCLNANLRSAPKLNEPIAPFFFKSFSASLCQAIPSLPLWYKLSKQELNFKSVFSSIIDFNS